MLEAALTLPPGSEQEAELERASETRELELTVRRNPARLVEELCQLLSVLAGDIGQDGTVDAEDAVRRPCLMERGVEVLLEGDLSADVPDRVGYAIELVTEAAVAHWMTPRAMR
jgi:hypothetical protein